MLRVVGTIAVLALTIYALVDCVQTPDDEVKGLPKLVWVFVILITPPIGALGWFIAGHGTPKFLPNGLRGPGSYPPGTNPTGKPDRPRGPDDDPDFLRNL